MKLLALGAFVISLVSASAAVAQFNPVIAKCTGNGADFYLSESPVDALVGSVPEPLPTNKDTILVVDQKKGMYWSNQSRAAIDRACGGQGNEEIALFDGVQPRSGLWQARLGETRPEGCPAILASMFGPGLPGHMPAELSTPRQLTFGVPFHPDQLELTKTLAASGISAVNWRTAGEDSWQADIMSDIFAQIPGGPGKGSGMAWRLTVTSKDRIDHNVTVTIALPAEAAALMGMSGDCRVTSDNQWVRVGD
ncbi:hypothetical protein [Devosia neptuniae]|jgi:hypothetical protein|uniref:hypothetical protein n=1 Tax=Devosia TaxID=46913 RepID=UPI0022AE95C2|nr:hypothetical protein [Devosia neptuniae]MCZ4346341.1 hypothetical protein [Devosia neptuniae]|tara:strand:- start:3876 stop:4628 length:753 start_codon:yes stop_codon:yes gene_type:complete